MIDKLLKDGRLKSFNYNDGKMVIKEKPAPMYHIEFKAIDKRLLKQKKKSKVIDIDMVVPQDSLPEVWATIMQQLDILVESIPKKPTAATEGEEDG